MKKLRHVKFELNVNLDDVLTKVGVFGRWQQRTVVLLMIASFIGGNVEVWILKSIKSSSFYSGLPMMNSSVTVGLPKRFACQRRDCQPRWSKAGQANAYNRTWLRNIAIRNSSYEEDGYTLLKPEVAPIKPPIDYSPMCRVVDCEFQPLKTLVSFLFVSTIIMI